MLFEFVISTEECVELNNDGRILFVIMLEKDYI